MTMALPLKLISCLVLLGLIKIDLATGVAIRFRVSARGLPSMEDKFEDPPDAFAVVHLESSNFLQDGTEILETRVQLGRTTTIDDNVNPRWPNVFTFDYQTWNYQYLNIEFREDDTGGKDDDIGWGTIQTRLIAEAGTSCESIWLKNRFTGVFCIETI